MDILGPKFLLESLNTVFGSLKCVSEVIVGFGFVLKNVEHESRRFCHAYELKTLWDCSKLVATKGEFTKIKTLLRNNDAIESCRRERAISITEILPADNS